MQKQIEENQHYISLIENYNPQTFTQHVIHEYVHEVSLIRTAEKLNQLGHKIKSQDISVIIQSQPDPHDLLHKEMRRLYLKKIRNLT